eukprot:COSAG05_NODE_13914_length_414_cov_0.822222_1_plen_49_part_00
MALSREAHGDWAEDMGRFSPSAHIVTWLDELRNNFREQTAGEPCTPRF